MVSHKTVNVLHFNGPNPTDLQTITSFTDDLQGNKAAEKVFAAWIRMAACTEVSDEELCGHTDRGYFEVEETAILLTHST